MKRRIILLFTLLLMVNTVLIAQTPDWQWATQAGGTNWDGGIGITIDDAGNSYVTGSFCETATFGSYSLTSSGYYDIFVAKMDAIGNWQWATQAGGTDLDEGIAITIDDEGKCYITGHFRDTATFGSYTLTSNGILDIFVAKTDANGNWIWAAKAGGMNFADRGKSITIDNARNTYVTGNFSGTATFGSYSITSSGEKDIFVAKMDANGNWQWVTKAGGSDSDNGYGITIDNAGNCYLTGNFKETATFGSYSLISDGYADIFVSEIDSDGNWQWATKAGGSDWDEGIAITIDEDENTYITGYFEGTATFGSHSITSNGYGDIFVSEIDSDGNWQWANQAGGAGGIEEDVGYGITIDNTGNCYITGEFRGTATFGSYSITSNGDEDIFVAKLNSSVFVENGIIPTEIQLSNYPNPFNPSTTISFFVTQTPSFVTLDIYNIKGQKVKQLVSNHLTSGEHSIIWNGKDMNKESVSSGIYFYKLSTKDKTFIKKMILLR